MGRGGGTRIIGTLEIRGKWGLLRWLGLGSCKALGKGFGGPFNHQQNRSLGWW